MKSWSKIVDWPVDQKTCCSQHYQTSQSTNLLGQQWWWSCSLDSVDSSYQSLKRGWKCSSQVTDSHSVDVESLRRKSVESPARWECLSSSCWSNSNAIIFSEKENLKNKFCFTRSSSGRGTVSSSSSVVGLSQVVWWSQSQLSSSWSGSPRWALPSRGRAGRGSSLRTGTWSSHCCRSTRGFPGSHRPGRQQSHTFENFGGFLCFPWEKKGESKWWIVFKAESWWLRP